MLMLSYPSRWKYDIYRALDYFQFAGISYDPRMQDALDILKKKRRKAPIPDYRADETVTSQEARDKKS